MVAAAEQGPYARGIATISLLHHTGFRNTVHTEAHSAPPMLKVAATLGSFLWISFGVFPFSCRKHEPSIATPVAPTGCPFAIKPPDKLMAQSPSTLALPSTQYRAPWPGDAFPRTSVPMAAATVKQSWISATFTSAGRTPAISYAFFIARDGPVGTRAFCPSFF